MPRHRQTPALKQLELIFLPLAPSKPLKHMASKILEPSYPGSYLSRLRRHHVMHHCTVVSLSWSYPGSQKGPGGRRGPRRTQESPRSPQELPGPPSPPNPPAIRISRHLARAYFVARHLVLARWSPQVPLGAPINRNPKRLPGAPFSKTEYAMPLVLMILNRSCL